MKNTLCRTGRITGGRLGALAAAACMLAGCATGYTLVQPDGAGGGSYYTSAEPAEPYADLGYDDDGDFGYAPGWGYAGAYGWGWPGGFGLGISSGWGWPGYGGPWSTGLYPGWGYGGGWAYGWRHHSHHHGRVGTIGGGARRAWLGADRVRVPSSLARGTARPISAPEHALETAPDRNALESAGFAPHTRFRARADVPDVPGRVPGAAEPWLYVPRVAAPMGDAAPRGFVAPSAAMNTAPRFAVPMAPPPPSPPVRTAAPATRIR